MRPPRRVVTCGGAGLAGLLLAVAIVGGCPPGSVRADEPSAVRPTALTAPLPLDTSPASAVQPRRPLPDWKLLAAIAAAFAVLAAVRLATGRRPLTPPPPDVFEVLGTAPVAAGHTARIVRFGPKTLLVAVSASGCHTLAELTDPQATEAIATACRAATPRPSRGRVVALPPAREAS